LLVVVICCSLLFFVVIGVCFVKRRNRCDWIVTFFLFAHPLMHASKVNHQVLVAIWEANTRETRAGNPLAFPTALLEVKDPQVVK